MNNASAAFKDLCTVASERAAELTQYKTISAQHGSTSENKAEAPIMVLFTAASSYH